jgi:transposase
LSARQQFQVRRWICGKDPRQHGFDFGLWTRRIVAELVEEKFKHRLSVTAVGRLLATLEITPQKPLRRAYERDPIAIAKWKEKDYPKLKARAKRRGADIFFIDEAGVRSDAALQRTWGAKGETPIVATSGQRQRVNAISAVNASGAFWYDVYTGKFNAALFITKLKAFMRRRRRPVFLVLDGHPAHRAKIVAAYVQSLKGQLELHFLPGYAPDLNPDEFVWNHLRQSGVTKTPLKQNEQLKARVEKDLAKIKRSPRLVRSFFRAESVGYILD